MVELRMSLEEYGLLPVDYRAMLIMSRRIPDMIETLNLLRARKDAQEQRQEHHDQNPDLSQKEHPPS